MICPGDDLDGGMVVAVVGDKAKVLIDGQLRDYELVATRWLDVKGPAFANVWMKRQYADTFGGGLHAKLAKFPNIWSMRRKP